MNKLKLLRNIIIGSANFTQKYGADLKKINYNEVSNILNLAKKKNICKIDTAQAYLKNKKIFTNIDKKFMFFSKVLPDDRWISLEFCEKKLTQHLNQLNKNKLETIFFHDTKILFSKSGKKIFENFEILKKKKFFKKIGLSIYDTDCLNYIISNYNFKAIQCPFNILDKRIVTTGWCDKLKNQGIETHIRSIFLQGLLVNELVYKKKYFKKWKPFFLKWFEELKKNNISPIDYCLTDLLYYDFDKIVIGINNAQNLKEIINFKTIKKNNMINLNIKDKKLIDPRKWK